MTARVDVPILYYHRVQSLPVGFTSWSKERRAGFSPTNVLPELFAAQLDWLAAHCYTTILPRDLAAYWDHGRPLPPKPVMLTFDDGSLSWRETVFPLLKAHGMVAEFYVCTSLVTDRRFGWEDVRAFAAAGMGIGAHDIHHVTLAGVPGRRPAPIQMMRLEVEGARRLLLERAGVVADSMAYVGGGLDDTLVGVVRAAGYSTARTIFRGVDQHQDLRYRLRVSRIGMYDDVVNLDRFAIVPGLPTFANRVSGRDPG